VYPGGLFFLYNGKRQHAADDKTARWLSEKSDDDLDFRDEE
jgi:hypothetical protein